MKNRIEWKESNHIRWISQDESVNVLKSSSQKFNDFYYFQIEKLGDGRRNESDISKLFFILDGYGHIELEKSYDIEYLETFAEEILNRILGVQDETNG